MTPPQATSELTERTAQEGIRAETERGCRLFQCTEAEWNDWKWQLRRRLRNLADAEKIFRLSSSERVGLARNEGRMAMGITPYYAAAMDPDNPSDPLRKTVMPHMKEFQLSSEDMRDPCGEETDEVVPGLVHRYPDRVLFLPLNQCPVYCRYCTRKRWVGETEPIINRDQLERVAAYLESHPEVRDVLISGGDPLMLSEGRLDMLLGRLRAIPSIEILRIGTKVPPTLPMRITKELTDTLRKYHPLWINVHMTHPAELTPSVVAALGRLVDAGIPLGSQTVLLKGVNDTPEIMKRLMTGLVRARVRPYYIYQCDLITGATHFRTEVAKGVEIIESLRGHITGFAVPQFVIDGPGGGGKIPINPEYVVSREDGKVVLRNYEGKIYEYFEPATRRRRKGASRAPAAAGGQASAG
jgi:lysine 2,3-aminomutase